MNPKIRSLYYTKLNYTNISEFLGLHVNVISNMVKNGTIKTPIEVSQLIELKNEIEERKKIRVTKWIR